MSAGVPGMTSNRPYLLRAVHEWIVDNGMTPQIVVDAMQDQVRVPAAYVHDGKIVLNISAAAVHGLSLDNERVAFSARFGGAPFDVVVPVRAVVAIMARENGVGMAFPDQGSDPGPDPGDDQPPPSPPPEPRKRPSLRVVK